MKKLQNLFQSKSNAKPVGQWTFSQTREESRESMRSVLLEARETTARLRNEHLAQQAYK